MTYTVREPWYARIGRRWLVRANRHEYRTGRKHWTRRYAVRLFHAGER